MRTILKVALPALVFAILLGTVKPPAAKAQIGPDVKVYLYENGVRVGEIYVPDRAADQSQYLEHWVLYPNYMYPGPKFIGALEIVPSPTEPPYASEQDFFRRVPFGPGYKYIRVTAQESTSLPTGR